MLGSPGAVWATPRANVTLVIWLSLDVRDADLAGDAVRNPPRRPERSSGERPLAPAIATPSPPSSSRSQAGSIATSSGGSTGSPPDGQREHPAATIRVGNTENQQASPLVGERADVVVGSGGVPGATSNLTSSLTRYVPFPVDVPTASKVSQVPPPVTSSALPIHPSVEPPPPLRTLYPRGYHTPRPYPSRGAPDG